MPSLWYSLRSISHVCSLKLGLTGVVGMEAEEMCSALTDVLVSEMKESSSSVLTEGLAWEVEVLLSVMADICYGSKDTTDDI